MTKIPKGQSKATKHTRTSLGSQDLRPFYHMKKFKNSNYKHWTHPIDYASFELPTIMTGFVISLPTVTIPWYC